MFMFEKEFLLDPPGSARGLSERGYRAESLDRIASLALCLRVCSLDPMTLGLKAYLDAPALAL